MDDLGSVRDDYARDGYVVARAVVGPQWVRAADEHVRSTIARHAEVPYARLHQIPFWREDPFYLSLVRQPGMLDLAERFLGPDLALFAAGYIVKAPASAMEVLWHQDGSYWPLEPMEVCTLWLAITESDAGNGCMRVIRGSHTMDLQALRERRDRESLLGNAIDDEMVDESQAVDLELAPGDVSVHHPNIVHGSRANAAPDRWRLNLVARVIAASTQVTDPNWPGVHHLRGRRRADVNRYLPDPE